MTVPDHGQYASKDWTDPNKGRAAMISRLDRDVGRVMDKLKSLGLDDNTIVFFTSDNGPHPALTCDIELFGSQGPFRGMKTNLYEGGIRVPMIVRWPSRVAPGGETDFPCAFWDFLPTACELAGVETPEGLDGQSILPTILGKKQTPHEFLYWEYPTRGYCEQAARMGDWKAHRRRPNSPIELYDLSKDIGETDNVAISNLDVVKRFREVFETAHVDNPHFPLKGR